MPTLAFVRRLLAAVLVAAAASPALAQDKVTFLTSWYAQAEHGGFYQAVATGLYKKHGLDVTIKMGGPQVNGTADARAPARPTSSWATTSRR